VVIPTETVYGLAARAADRKAVEAIFSIKERPGDNPLIVHVASLEQLGLVGAEPSPLARKLAAAFWPGPLTLVVNSRSTLPWVSAGLDSIAVRCPSHPFAAALIKRVGPLAAPSANLSGRPSPTRAGHVLEDLDGRVPLVIDGGDLTHGIESTVVDARGDIAVLLRPGSITAEQLQECAGHPVAPPAADLPVRSPGMKYRHYSPKAQVWLYPSAAGGETDNRLLDDARRLQDAGFRVAAITHRSVDVQRHIALPAEASEVARKLFGWLRDLDADGIDCILVEGISAHGIGRAVMDRLERAASRVRGDSVPPIAKRQDS
jgi:L-threonylcarbamoyladenylate synthase